MQDGVNFEFQSQGKKHWQCQLSRLIDVDTQSTSVLPTPSFCDSETEITGELPRGWGDSAFGRGRDAHRKFWIKPLKETDLGVAQTFFDP